MKVRREILIIFSMILLLVLPAMSLGKEIKWVLERPVIPVLVKKPASPVLKVTLIRADNQPYTIQQIDLDLLGSTDVADVVSVAIYGTQENGLIDTSRLLYKSLPAARKISFTDKVQVNQDSLSFWVAVTLKDTVSLDHRIQLNCNRIKTTKGNLKISEKGSKPLRVGVAVRQKGQDGCVSSRIPGLATSNQGTLLAIFDARYDYSRDLQGNIDIALHRSTDQGLTWQPVQTVLDMGEWGGLPQKYNGVSDACILVDKNTGDIYVAGLWMCGLLDKDGKWIEGLNESSTVWTHQWKGKGSQPGTGLKETCQFMIAKSTDADQLETFIGRGFRKTKNSSIVIVTESPGNKNGGAMHYADRVKREYPGYDVRVSILGHLQRGGAPSANDRILASRLGEAAIQALMEDQHNIMVGIHNNEIVYVPFDQAIKNDKPIDKNLIRVLNELSI